MKQTILKYCFLTALTFILALNSLFGQIPDFSKSALLHDGDSLNIVYLVNNGVKISDDKVIAWFPKDSLSVNQMNEMTGMINKGIRGAEKLIGAPLPWQQHNMDEPYTFYFRFDRFISHASHAGFVSIPFWRIKEGKAPWLHEVMHEMLNSRNGDWFNDTITEKYQDEHMPLWLFEGMPDYISAKVSLAEKLPRFDVFANSHHTDIDSLFVNEIKSDKGTYILSFIGTKGAMPELFSDNRKLYAPAFYHGSASFVKFLAEKYDIKILLSGISTFGMEQETIEKLTGKPFETLKKEWLNKLNVIK